MPLFRCFAASLACSASVEGAFLSHLTYTITYTITCPSHTYLGGEWGGGGVRLRYRVEPGSTRLSCLQRKHHTLVAKSAKVSKLLVRFTRFPPTCPGLPYFGSPPLSLLITYLAYRDTASCFARNAEVILSRQCNELSLFNIEIKHVLFSVAPTVIPLCVWPLLVCAAAFGFQIAVREKGASHIATEYSTVPYPISHTSPRTAYAP